MTTSLFCETTWAPLPTRASTSRSKTKTFTMAPTAFCAEPASETDTATMKLSASALTSALS